MTYFNEHFMVQSETIRNEGVWWFVETRTEAARSIERRYEYETAFVGRGARDKAQHAFDELVSEFERLHGVHIE